MKKEGIVFILFVISILLISISFVSAESNETELTNVTNANESIVNVTESANETEIEYINITIEAGITPDNVFYGMDVFVDNVRATLTPGSLGKAKARLDIMQERMAEMEEMVESNKTAEANKAKLEGQKQIEKFERSVEKIKKKDAAELNVYVQNYNARLEERKQRLMSWGEPDYADAIAEAIKMFEEVENAIVNIPEDLDPESTFKLSLICEEAGATTPEECKEMIAGGLLVSVSRGVGEGGEKRTPGPLDCGYGNNISYGGFWADYRTKTRFCCKDSDGYYSPEHIEYLRNTHEGMYMQMDNYYYMKGTVDYKLINLETGEIEEGIERDSCDGNTLTEWVCPTRLDSVTRNERFSVEYDCSYRCEYGACINCNLDFICDENEGCSCSDCEGEGCGQNYSVCQNGECVQGEVSEWVTEEEFEGKCTDSDEGLDYFVKGTLIGKSQTTNFTQHYIDSCMEDSYLGEGYCGANNEVHIMRYLCPKGCEGGVCVQ